MRLRLHLAFLLTVAAGLSACARAAMMAAAIRPSWIPGGRAARVPSKSSSKTVPGPQRYAGRTATLNMTVGLQVAGISALPEDFQPDMNRAPLWLDSGSEIGVIGSRSGKGVMLGISGAGLSHQRVVLEDYGTGAPGGKILDVTVNNDGRKLATVSVVPSEDRLDVNVIDTLSADEVQTVASLKGEFEAAQLTWLTNGKLALAVQALTPALTSSAVPVSALYVITLGQSPSIRRLDGIKCQLSALAFSPDNAIAVAQGGSSASPAVLDMHRGTCSSFPSAASLQVLGWAPHSETFLYRTADHAGVFRFDVESGRRSTIAVSSGAAGYASDGTIIAVGSQQLSWRRIANGRLGEVKVQVALFDPHQSLITINSLGFATQPALLAQSSMVISPVSNNAIIDTATPGQSGPERELIEYSYPARAAFVLARGVVQGPIGMSWSPDGRRIAIVDGNSTLRTVSVIAPPE